MNKKILFLILLAVLVLPVIALAQAAGGATLDSKLTAVKSAAVSLGGAIVVIGWVVAGILYLTAAGAPEKLGVAKKALVACVIGTVLVALAITATNAMDLIKNIFGL